MDDNGVVIEITRLMKKYFILNQQNPEGLHTLRIRSSPINFFAQPFTWPYKSMGKYISENDLN